MSLSNALRQHYKGKNQEQMKLEEMYNAQQARLGKAGLEAQRELVKKLQEKGINVRTNEVAYMEHIHTGEKIYYKKG